MSFDFENAEISEWPEEFQAARVVEQHPYIFSVRLDGGDILDVPLQGKYKKRAKREGLPVVGDWVALSDDMTIVGRSRRKSAVYRKHPRRTQIQCLAANLDQILIVFSLGADVPVGSIDRFVGAALAGGAEPLVIFNKADLHPNPEQVLQHFTELYPDIPLRLLCAHQQHSVDAFREALHPGTKLLFGASGVGKSTLANALCGREVMRVGLVRASDGSGRHTTTTRRLFEINDAEGALIDIPGIRDLVPVGDVESLAPLFPELWAHRIGCRFRNCQHRSEHGCAVLTAMHAEHLTESYVQRFQKLADAFVAYDSAH